MKTEIDETFHLVQTMLTEGELIIFLGAGSSVEGTQGSTSFPDFNTLIDRVLSDLNVNGENDRWDKFLEIIRIWEKESEPSIRLNDYLYGKPGLPHIQLASISMSLFPDVNMTLFLTTNFDDLMFKAFMEVAKGVEKRDPKLFTLNNSGVIQVLETVLNVIPKHTKKGVGVIIKLFGDLNSESPIFHSEKMRFDKNTEDWLSTIFHKPILFIGYSLRDSPILRLFIKSQSKSPIFLVGPNSTIPENIEELSQRNFYSIAETFGDFTNNLIEILTLRKENFERNFNNFIKYADNSIKFGTFGSISKRLKKCSKVSLLRYRKKNYNTKNSNGLNSFFEPILRFDTSPDIKSFLKSSKPILGIIGESGVGKSTVLYSFVMNENDNYITLFYDVHNIQIAGSLIGKIAIDLYTDILSLDNTLEHINRILKSENKFLIIVLDAINESSNISPQSLRYEIEGFGSRLPSNIKLIFTCRKVYWEANMNYLNDIPIDLYFGNQPFLLNNFSHQEATIAYQLYKKTYNLRTDWENLSDSVKEHIHDPLMLKFISEAYSNSYLPDFAPAVIVFDKYLQAIRLKYKHQPLLDFIDSLIDYNLDDFSGELLKSDVYTYSEIRTNQRLHLLTLQQQASNKFSEQPLVLLEDEKLITPVDTTANKFKFTYERFYEYLIGTRLEERIFSNTSIDAFFKLKELIPAYYNAHYSFYQGLKSAVIGRFIRCERDNFMKRFAINLIHNHDLLLKRFGKEILRELVIDSKYSIYDLLDFENMKEEEQIALILDVAPDKEQMLPIIIKGLFSKEQSIRIKSCYALLKLRRSHNNYVAIEKELLKAIKSTSNIESIAVALCYFVPIIFMQNPNNSTYNVSEFTHKISQTDRGELILSQLGLAFAATVKTEGYKFFGNNYAEIELIYPWRKESEQIEPFRLSILSILEKPTIENIFQHIDDVRFFSSLEKEKNSCEIFAYQIEYRIIQWILVRLSRDNFLEILKFLDEIVYNGNYFNIDFSLGVVEFAIFNLFKNDQKYVAKGANKLKEWTNYFEEKDPKFYLAIDQPAPFAFNFVPLVMLARVEAHFFTKDNEPVDCLSQYLGNKLDKKKKLALLSIKWLSKDFSVKMLNTIEPFVNIINLKNWIDHILIDINIHSPRLIEDFMSKCKFSTDRRSDIRSPSYYVDPNGFQFDGETLYSTLFLSSKNQLNSVQKWYEKIYTTGSLEIFCQDLIDSFK